ncbi:MAG: hypothetical protein ACTSU5_17945 [Promethearchaeota archaeon]
MMKDVAWYANVDPAEFVGAFRDFLKAEGFEFEEKVEEKNARRGGLRYFSTTFTLGDPELTCKIWGNPNSNKVDISLKSGSRARLAGLHRSFLAKCGDRVERAFRPMSSKEVFSKFGELWMAGVMSGVILIFTMLYWYL